MVDILIKNGTIIDGTGNVGFKGHVVIDGDRLNILVGDPSSIVAADIIDAAGCIVAPGFIDVHNHSDLMALAEPKNEPKIRQGVTTEVVGLDGIGYAPLSKSNLELMLLFFCGLNGYPELDYNWNSVAGYLKGFYHTTSGNIAYLIPNSCLRAETVGWEMSAASPDEIRQMQDMIRQGMAEGAVGLSSGLVYPPGSYAGTGELVALCRTVAECGGVYVTHVRYHLGDGLFDGFREAVNIGMQSGCPVHISHYSTRLQLRGRADRMLEFIDEARAGGCDLTFDAYPYEATSTAITSALPQWSHSGGPHELIRRLRDEQQREKMRREPARPFSEIDKMIVSAVRTEKNKWCQGLTVAEVAEKMKKDTWETICYLMLEENLEVAFFSVSGNMTDVKGIMMHPAHMFISDGLRIGDVPNPRTYGSFPRVLGQLVRDEKVMPLEQAIRKMTSFPAQRFGLRDRGILRDGMKADIVVFNPALVSGTATFTNPKQFPIGIDYVLVNGKLVIERGRHTGRLPGEPLTRRS